MRGQSIHHRRNPESRAQRHLRRAIQTNLREINELPNLPHPEKTAPLLFIRQMKQRCPKRINTVGLLMNKGISEFDAWFRMYHAEMKRRTNQQKKENTLKRNDWREGQHAYSGTSAFLGRRYHTYTA